MQLRTSGLRIVPDAVGGVTERFSAVQNPDPDLSGIGDIRHFVADLMFTKPMQAADEIAICEIA